MQDPPADDRSEDPPAAGSPGADPAGFARRVAGNVERVVLGKTAAVELLVAAVLCRGHVLVEDVPGTGKTMLARALAASLGVQVTRIQCTPDLLPTEVTGVSVYDPAQRAFDFRPGPVFTNVLLVDEVNRATPRTQSALLEAMAERQVSVEGTPRRLPEPFVVLATQNPVEAAGTFPLPEAQLDRFLVRVRLGYPSREAEVAAVRARRDVRTGRDPIDRLGAVARGDDLPGLWAHVAGVHVDADVEAMLFDVVAATRTHPDVAVGASVRGSLALYRACQALAAVRGRGFVTPADVKRLAVPVLAHRLVLHPDSLVRGRTPERVVEQVLADTAVPITEGRDPDDRDPDDRDPDGRHGGRAHAGTRS